MPPIEPDTRDFAQFVLESYSLNLFACEQGWRPWRDSCSSSPEDKLTRAIVLWEGFQKAMVNSERIDDACAANPPAPLCIRNCCADHGKWVQSTNKAITRE